MNVGNSGAARAAVASERTSRLEKPSGDADGRPPTFSNCSAMFSPLVSAGDARSTCAICFEATNGIFFSRPLLARSFAHRRALRSRADRTMAILRTFCFSVVAHQITCTNRNDRRDCESIERCCHRYYTFGLVRAALPLRLLAPDAWQPTDNPCAQADCGKLH